MQIGNTVKYKNDVDKNKTEFVINSFESFRECVSVLVLRVKERKLTRVIFEECDYE